MLACRTTLILAFGWSALFPAAALAGPAGKVVIAQGTDPSTLDAMNQLETPAFNVCSQVFESLLALDESLRAIPALAQELPRLISPTVLEFTLRRGVRFHNGEEFNADSVKFSLERALNPANKLRGTPRPNAFDHVEIVDPYTVRVHTREPWPMLVKILTLPITAMYPPRAYADRDSAYISKNPIGTGPYKFVRWLKDEEIVFESNTSYWGGVPKVKTVVFRAIPDDAVRVAALQTGEIDLAVNIPLHLASAISAHPKLFVSTVPSVRTIQLMFYTHQFDADHKVVGPYAGPTADRRIRQAIAAALDPDEIIARVLDGKGKRIATLLTSLHFGFDPGLTPARRDPERARRLLTEAGYANGLDLSLNTPFGRYVRDKEVAESIAGQLAKVGIRTRVQAYEFVTFMNTLIYVHKAGPMFLVGWGVPYADASSVYRPLFRSGSMFANYFNPELDQRIDEASATMDEGRRLELYHPINKLWLEDVPAVPLYQQVDVYGMNKRLVWHARSDELLRAYDMALKP